VVGPRSQLWCGVGGGSLARQDGFASWQQSRRQVAGVYLCATSATCLAMDCVEVVLSGSVGKDVVVCCNGGEARYDARGKAWAVPFPLETQTFGRKSQVQCRKGLGE